MRNYLPYIFPVIAILIIGALVFNWYRQNTQPQGQISEFARDIQVEELSTPVGVTTPVEDLNTVQLDSAEGVEASGVVRYSQEGDQLAISVIATLPQLEQGMYQVWLREIDGEGLVKVASLEMNKGGYQANFRLSAENLPFQVVVSQETTDDEQLETEVLSATLEENS